MEVLCRLADENDLQQLAQMRWDFRMEGAEQTSDAERAEFVDKCAAFLRRGLIEKSWVYWVAEVDGKIVSHVFVQRITKVPKPGRISDEFGYLTNVYSRPQYRGKGVGFELLQRVCKWAREIELEFMIVWPSDSSREFYRRAGFAPEHQAMTLFTRP